MNKFKIILFSFFILILASCSDNNLKPETKGEGSIRSESYARGAYSLTLSFPAEPVVYGNTIEIELSLEYPEGEDFELPMPGSNDVPNAVILDIIRGRAAVSSSGIAVTDIKLRVEALLPGVITFPSISVKFKEEITTDEIFIEVESSFDGDEEQKELSPLYIPEAENDRGRWLVLLITAAIILIALIIFYIRRRGTKAPVTVLIPEKTIDEMIADFNADFMQADLDFELRDAFTRLEVIIERTTSLDPDERERFSTICREARFSKEGYTSKNGKIVLQTIFLDVTGGHNL